MQEMPLNELNSLLGNTKNMYMIILQKGWYPPPFGSCTTANYLIEYMKGSVMRFKKDELKRHVIYKNISAIKAFEILEEISDKKTGFDVFRLPPLEFLLDSVYTLNPSHEIF